MDYKQSELDRANQADADAQAVELSGVMMAHLAGNLSEKFDSFATWLLAGFGAAVALLLTSHEISPLVTGPTVRYCAKLFVVAVLVTVVQKYISIVVGGGSEGAAFARTTIKEQFKARKEDGLPPRINFPLFISEFLRPLFKPALLIAAPAVRKIQAGDTNAGSRLMVILSQIQGALLIVEVGFFVAAIWRIVETLPSA